MDAAAWTLAFRVEAKLGGHRLFGALEDWLFAEVLGFCQGLLASSE